MKHYVILNGFIVTLVVISFLLLRRTPKGPVKLELRDENVVASDQARDAKVVPEKPRPKFRDPRLGPGGGPPAEGAGGKPPIGWDTYQPRTTRLHIEVLETEAPGERSLNALFNWNGHTWDAYEVLGLPGGSSIESARKAFDRAAALADKETLPFLKAALQVIVSS